MSRKGKNIRNLTLAAEAGGTAVVPLSRPRCPKKGKIVLKKFDFGLRSRWPRRCRVVAQREKTARTKSAINTAKTPRTKTTRTKQLEQKQLEQNP